MTDRVITEDDKDKILDALAKGDKRGKQLVELSVDRSALQRHFEQAVWSAEHCLEHFTKTALAEENETPKTLETMFFGAFKAIQCAEVLQTELNFTATSLLLEGRASDLQMALLKAVTAYKTNGNFDTESLCALNIINGYRAGLQKPSVPPPANTPINRAS